MECIKYILHCVKTICAMGKHKNSPVTYYLFLILHDLYHNYLHYVNNFTVAKHPSILFDTNMPNTHDTDIEPPTSSDALLSYLDDLGIAYDLHHHRPVFTVEESGDLDAKIPGCHCRNLFLRDKKKKMFLVVLANETKVDLKSLQDILECGRLSFGSESRLWENLGVRPGSVCPFAMINDIDKNVTVILDRYMMEQDIVCYHPMENDKTIALAPADLLKFLDSCGHKHHILDLTCS